MSINNTGLFQCEPGSQTLQTWYKKWFEVEHKEKKKKQQKKRSSDGRGGELKTNLWETDATVSVTNMTNR